MNTKIMRLVATVLIGSMLLVSYPPQAFSQNMGGDMCGQWQEFRISENQTLYFFADATDESTILWVIEPTITVIETGEQLDASVLAGHYVRIWMPDFAPEGAATYGYADKQLLTSVAGYEIVSSCPEAVPAEDPTPTPLSSSQPPQVMPEQTLNMQGEIAYVLDGDIWLLDLVSGGSRQLTSDGDNRWPAWSDDGRYLLYTHATSDDEMALYLLEADKKVQPQLLAENACCAAWEKNGERIAYISIAGDEPSVAMIQPDSSGQETLVATLHYGRSSWPVGNMHWDGNELLLPLEVVDNATGAGLIDYTGVFYADLGTGALQPIESYGQGVDCSIGHPDYYRNSSDVPILAGDFVGGDHCGGVRSFDQGVWIDELEHVRELPQLAYPSFSSDHVYLVAERYAEGADSASDSPQGIVLYNLADDSEQLLVEGGSQPAWRPAAPIPPAVMRHLQPGERVASIQPALTWQGATWQAHLLTTAKLAAVSPKLLVNASSEGFKTQGVTALVVTKDQSVVKDPALLRQFFLLYNAADALYDNPPDELIPTVGEQLKKVLDNEFFKAMAIPQLLRSQRSQTTEVLRALLTDATQAQTTLDPLFTQAFATTPTTVEKALDALGATIENSAASNAVLISLRPDLAAAYAGLADSAQGEKVHLQLLRLTAQLIFLNQLQAERGEWLQSYLDAFPSGEGSFDRDQLRAAADVLEEVKSNSQQRIDIATTFLGEMRNGLILDKSGEVARKAVSEVAASLAEKYGVRLASNSVAGLLSAAMVGMTVGNLLYGTDELYANFSLAADAEELRTTFHSGRQVLQNQAASQQQRLIYDGDLAERFRVAYLLESLAAIESQRSYADGVAATFQLPNPLQLINWLRGEDWQAAVAELHKRADEQEAKLLSQFATPTNLEPLLTLAATRLGTLATAPECKKAPARLYPEWTTYSSGNRVNDMLLVNDTLWSATSGGVVCWNVLTGAYNQLMTDDGLVSNNVSCIIQSADGALWFGTDSGVSRLTSDGRWTTFTLEDVLANRVTSILQSEDGALWFGTAGSGVSRLAGNGQWTTFASGNGPADKYSYIMSILQSADGALWFGTLGGVRRLAGDGLWATFTTTDGLAGEGVSSILQSEDGTLWFGTGGGVSRLTNDGQWTTFTSENGLANNEVTSILQSADSALWFGTIGGLSRLAIDGHWTTFTTGDGLADNWVNSMLQSEDGALWFGTLGGGVNRLGDDEQFMTFATNDGLKGDGVLSMLQSSDSTLWFGTTDGVSRLAGDGQWTTFTAADGLAGTWVKSILQSKDGALWFGTGDGASRLTRDGDWMAYTTADGLADNSVSSIIQSVDGALWFGTGGGLSRFTNDGQWTTFTIDDGLVSNNVRCILQSADGALWFGTDGGVSRLASDGQWTTFAKADELANNDVYSILQSEDGTLWIGTLGSVSRLDSNGQWTTFTNADGLAGGAIVNSIIQGEDDALWFGTGGGGVSRLAGDGQWTTFTTEDGLGNDNIWSILQSEDGTLWFGTGGVGNGIGGVSRYQPVEK